MANFNQQFQQFMGGGATPPTGSLIKGSSFNQQFNQFMGGQGYTPPASQPMEEQRVRTPNIFQRVSDIITTKLNSIVRGGTQAGIQRVKTEYLPSFKTELPAYFAPATKYVVDTAKSAVNSIKGLGKLTPAYMTYRAVTGKPVQPKEYVTNIATAGIEGLTTLWRTRPIAPVVEVGLSSWKGVRQYLQGKITKEELLETPLKGLEKPVGFGEIFTDNVKLAEALDITFMATIVLTPFAKRKLNQLNLTAEEINQASKTLGVKPSAPLSKVSEALRKEIKKIPDAFTSNPSQASLARRGELTEALNILKKAGVIEKKWATAYDYLGKRFGLKPTSKVVPPKAIPAEVPKENIEPSVVQIKDIKTNAIEVKAIPKGKLESFKNVIDTGESPIAGEEIEGKVYHLTAKTPEEMVEQGAKYTGIAKLEDIPKTTPPSKLVGEGRGVVSKELEPLAEEARKYKSAEEFVKSQGVFLPRKSAYGLTPLEEAKRHLNSSIKEGNETIQRLEKQLSGMLKGESGKQYLKDRIASEKTILTKSQQELQRINQLSDFYTQATKGIKPKVEEFVSGDKVVAITNGGKIIKGTFIVNKGRPVKVEGRSYDIGDYKSLIITPEGKKYQFGEEKEMIKEIISEVKPEIKPVTEGVKGVEEELAGEVEKRIGEISPPIGFTTKRVYKPPISDKIKGGEVKFSDSEIESRYRASKGVTSSENLKGKIKNFFRETGHRITRVYPDLPNKPEYAEIRNILNKQKNVREVAQERTLRILDGVTADIGKNKLDLFTRKVMLDDLVNEAKDGRAIPLGYSEYNEKGDLIIKTDLLNADKEAIDRLVLANPDVATALSRRDKIWKAITDELVQYDILDESQVKKNYFRHQVLEYVNAKTRLTRGVGKALKQRKPGYARRRMGSTYDINTDYLEVEFQVMAQALHDIGIAKLVQRIEKSPLNIKAEIVKEAKTKGVKDWHDLIPEGYVSWQPKEGRVFYSTYSIPEKVVNEFVDEIGKGTFKLDQDLINKAIAVGGKRKEFVLPQEVGKTLDNLWVAKQPNFIRMTAGRMMTYWKKWVLFNPRRAFKYNYQNFLGDVDAVLAGNPSAFKKLPQSLREIYEVFYGGKPMNENMKDFFERGGFSRMLTIQEIPDIKNVSVFERFYEKSKTKSLAEKINLVNHYWSTVVNFTQFRETLLRYASYLDYLDKFTSGKNISYGASSIEEVNALTDPKDKAAKVATELLGDYANISALGKDLRESVIPFYSWNEINLKRYPSILRNQWKQGYGKGSKAKILGLGTLKAGWKIWGALLRITALTGSVMLYNQLLHPDAEEDLSEYDRGRMHINLGYDKDGNVVILRGQGAFSDALEWFGLDEAPILWREYLEGKTSLVDIFGKIPLITGEIGLKPMAQKAIGAISPVYKIPTEALSGYTWPFQGSKPYPIENKWRQFFQNLQLENEYDWIFQKPSRGYAKSWVKAIVTITDPEENAYRYIQAEKHRYLETKGKGGTGNYYTPRSIVYRNYKKALVYGDKVAEQRAWEEMKKLGVTYKNLEQSLAWSDPLSGLNKAEKLEFVNEYLSQSDKERLKKANRYYEKVFLSR